MSETAIRLTERAARKIVQLAAENAVTGDMGLRVDIVGGAPSGFAYDLYFDSSEAGDRLLEIDGVRLLIRPDSARYLEGSTVDWVEGANGAGFRVDNPNEPGK